MESWRQSRLTRIAVIWGTLVVGMVLAEWLIPHTPDPIRKVEVITVPARHAVNYIRDSEDFAAAPVLDATSGEDRAALYFVGANEAGYTILRDVMRRPNMNVGYVYIDPKTHGVIVQIDNYRIGVR